MDENQTTVQLYTPAMMAQTLGISVRAIRLWYRSRLIQPTTVVMRIPYFDFSELSTANTFAHWMQQGMTAQSIARQLTELGHLWGKAPTEMVTTLPITLEGKRLVLNQDSRQVESNGQLRLCFDVESEGDLAEPVTLKFASPSGDTADHAMGDDAGVEAYDSLGSLLEAAMAAEDDEDLEMAARLYRRILSKYGPNADVCFQLAEVLYRQADLGGAKERYYAAIELDPGLVEARANLGCVLFEHGQADLAVAEFRQALEHYPEYADVHFHLARALDMQGQSLAAVEHWRQFLDLAPASPWADEAIARLAEQPTLEFED